MWICKTNSHDFILQKEIITVKTNKITTILNKSNAPKFIKFLSLYTERSEYEILKVMISISISVIYA